MKGPKRHALDFLSVFSGLSDEHRLVVQSTRQFVDKFCQPIIQDSFETGSFPLPLVQKMGELGLLGSHLTGYGCAGLDSLAYGLIMRELERCDSSIRSFASVQSSLVMYAIWEFGSEEQKKRLLPKMASGELIGCFGLTEPDFGSNPSGMRTDAQEDRTSWVINGSKTWITNAPIAHIAVVFAKTVEGIRAFLVERGVDGFETPTIHHKLSLRASETGSLFFKNCHIPKDNILPKAQGLKSALMCLNQARFGILFGVIGAAESCLSEALAYAEQRIVFDKPLAGFQLIQKKLVDMTSRIAQAQLLAVHLASLKDSHTLNPEQISLGKQNNVLVAMECARTSRDILGANGISGGYNSMRHMCNLESVYTYEGTNDIHLLAIGQAITGLSAFQ